MRYLNLAEILEIYRHVMDQSGGMVGIRDIGALESAVAQPRLTFAGMEIFLYLNGYEIRANFDEQVDIICRLLQGKRIDKPFQYG